MRCRAMPSPDVRCGRALPCGAVLCGAVPCCVLSLLYRTCQVFFDKVLYIGTTALDQQSNAVGCLALPCGAVLCGSLPCCAMLRAMLRLPFVHATSHSTKYHTAVPRYTTFVRTALLNIKTYTPSSALLKLSSGQHSAVRYPMRCHA